MLLTFDLKKEAWKAGESPDIELRWRGCDWLGLCTRMLSILGMPTLLHTHTHTSMNLYIITGPLCEVLSREVSFIGRVDWSVIRKFDQETSYSLFHLHCSELQSSTGTRAQACTLIEGYSLFHLHCSELQSSTGTRAQHSCMHSYRGLFTIPPALQWASKLYWNQGTALMHALLDNTLV